uniref:hypothetical protein n=1 Tax=Pseudomonas syringae TaxID=317 RepID=UPI00187F64C4|nr:hypothetical protein [Pseudomonas syringae]
MTIDSATASITAPSHSKYFIAGFLQFARGVDNKSFGSPIALDQLRHWWQTFQLQQADPQSIAAFIQMESGAGTGAVQPSAVLNSDFQSFHGVFLLHFVERPLDAIEGSLFRFLVDLLLGGVVFHFEFKLHFGALDVSFDGAGECAYW